MLPDLCKAFDNTSTYCSYFIPPKRVLTLPVFT